MELIKFFRSLYPNRFTLIFIPVITVIITFYLVRNLSDVYISQAVLSTGIVDNTQKSFNSDNSYQEAKINEEFSNLIEMMQMKKILDQVSYQLILHDLTSKKPFRAASKEVKDLNPAARAHAIAVFKDKYNKRETLSLWDADQNGLYRVLVSMRYDDASIKKNLNVRRAESSDFINTKFESENAQLSAYVVNMVNTEFINYYSYLVKENNNRSVSFLEDLLKEKLTAMNNKIAGLRSFKIENRVLNLYEQSKILYSQIMDFENKRIEAIRDIDSYNGALKSIDNKFNPTDRRYMESAMTKITGDILLTKDKLRSLTDSYIQSGFDTRYKKSIDSLRNNLTAEINSSTDKYISNPLSAKQDLIEQKLSLEIQLELAKYSVSSLNNELVSLNKRFDKLVPNEAVVQSYERDIEVSSKEYLDILAKYNQTRMDSDLSVKLRFVQAGMPGLPQPSKKMLLIILSGILSFIFCMVVFFILFFIDDSIKNTTELADKTGSPVLGKLNLIQGAALDLKKIWSEKNPSADIQAFKDQLRSLRFEINKELENLSGGSKVLAITSLLPQEGKTLASLSLAYTYAVTNKKVLIIDANFSNPALSETARPENFIENYLKTGELALDATRPAISMIGNKGDDASLFELADDQTIKQRMDHLKTLFDIIIIETGSIDVAKSKEWLPIADKILAVFEAKKSLNSSGKQQVDYLKGQGGKFIGWVLNKVKEDKN